MDVRKKLEREIEKQQRKLQELRNQIIAEEAYLKAQMDMLKFIPRSDEFGDAAMRAGGDPARVHEILEEEGTPMHLKDLLLRLEREDTKDARAALAGTLGWYVRKDEVFTRPAPSTFGLKSFAATFATEPPDDFGSDEESPILSSGSR